jgi:Tol biopolymer transport system component
MHSPKLLAAALAAALVSSAAPARAATTVLVSAVNGVAGDQESYQVDVSDDGNVVAFSSLAANWGFPNVSNGWHTFVLDRAAGVVTVLDGTPDGFGSSMSTNPAVSGNGRFVAFSTMDAFVAADTNSSADVYVYDRATGAYELASVSSAGVVGAPCGCDGWLDPTCGCELYGLSGEPSISADGRYVAFGSFSSNLVPGDDARSYDVFVHDRATGETSRIATGGDPSISGDGRFVAFVSEQALAATDANGVADVYVADRATGALELVSVATTGAAGNAFSAKPAISADGVRVAFLSQASNLVRRDGNGLQDVFCRDRAARTTAILSASVGGGDYPSISADGLQAAFSTGQAAYVTSTSSPRPVAVTVTTTGGQGYGTPFNTAVNGNGKVVAFDGYTVLSPADTNGAKDVYLRDLNRK